MKKISNKEVQPEDTRVVKRKYKKRSKGGKDSPEKKKRKLNETQVTPRKSKRLKEKRKERRLKDSNSS